MTDSEPGRDGVGDGHQAVALVPVKKPDRNLVGV
jgi:hypothetical protein